MFKTLEAKWNSHTPVWLHARTKENLIFQIGASFVVCGVMYAYGEWKDRRDFPSMHTKPESKD